MFPTWLRKIVSRTNGKPHGWRLRRTGPPRVSYRPWLEQFEDRTLPTTFALYAPYSLGAGTTFGLVIVALDANNNTASGYAGIVHFTSSDKHATLPADATLTGGVGNFSATLQTAGSMTLTATDTLSAAITGSTDISVVPGAATQFTITNPPTATAGTGFIVTVTAQDQFGNIATGYSGSVHFTSSDLNALLPLDSTLTAGTGVFSALLTTAGVSTLTVSDSVFGYITGTSGNIAVSPAGASLFGLNVPTSATGGTPFLFTVTALDIFGNTATGYGGTISFTSSDSAAQLPANATLASGMGTFTATLKTAGSQSIVATDTAAHNVRGSAQVDVTVIASGATHFAVSAAATVTAGNPVLFTVIAEDQSNNLATSYSGTVHFRCSDPAAQLPPDTTLSAGFGFFATLLTTAGPQTITATDTQTPSIAGSTGVITVQSAAADHLLVSAPTTAVTGTAFNFTVTAEDLFGNIATSYNGAVHFTSTDPGASLPANVTLVSGVGIFTATLKAAGSQTLTATDTTNSAIDGTSATIASRGLVVTNLLPTPSGFVAEFDKPFDPATLNLYDAASAGYGPTDVSLVGPSGTAVRGSLVLDPSDTSFTFLMSGTGAAAVLPAGAYTVTFRSAPNGFKDANGVLLDGNNSGMPGTNFVTQFTVATTPAVVLSLPEFARGPDGADNIKLPNNTGTGIPVTLSGAVNVTDVTFSMNYNPALLNVSGVQNGVSGTLTLQSATGGVANFVFHSSTPLSGSLTLGQIVAQVPNGAAVSYKGKDLLLLSNITVNASAAAAVGKYGLEVVAYLGDTAGQGVYSPLDAALISRVAVGLDSGFAAYPLLDPAIIADLTGSGVINSADVTLLNRFLAGIAQAQLPLIPSGLRIPATGPDPTMSLPAVLQAVPDGNVTVPVSISTGRPTGSMGLMSATLALRFNSRFFALSSSDIQLGTLPPASSDWQLASSINNQTGAIGITLFSTTPIQSPLGGSLVTIDLLAKNMPPPGTPALSLVSEVNPTGQRVYQTMASDVLGALVLHMGVTTAQLGPVDNLPIVNPPNAGQFDLVSSMVPAAAPLPLPRHSVMEQVFWDLESLAAESGSSALAPVPQSASLPDSPPDGVDAVALALVPASGFEEWHGMLVESNEPVPEGLDIANAWRGLSEPI